MQIKLGDYAEFGQMEVKLEAHAEFARLLSIAIYDQDHESRKWDAHAYYWTGASWTTYWTVMEVGGTLRA